ncbi:MAG: hypothetical protein IPO08_22975 [Xanthomonadales bacterium]|nr:hypothetical protein [Xanthomonadales bacterium]
MPYYKLIRDRKININHTEHDVTVDLPSVARVTRRDLDNAMHIMEREASRERVNIPAPDNAAGKLLRDLRLALQDQDNQFFDDIDKSMM